MKQRHGIAIITVVLLSALILIAITIVSAQAIAEKTMTTSQNAYKRALSVAEAGLTETITDLRNAQWTGSVLTMPAGSYVTTSMVTGVTGAPGLTDGLLGTIVVGAVKTWPDNTSTFQVKIKKLSDETVSTSPSISQTVTIPVGVYVMGQVYTDSTRAVSGLMARRVLYAEYDVKIGPVNATYNGLFDYALLTGGAMSLSGSSEIDGGSIRANGVIDVGSKKRLYNADGSSDTTYAYKAYTSAVTGNGQGLANSSSWVDSSKPAFVFPAPSMAYYEALADDFKGGTGLYNGSGGPTYPNTHTDTSEAIKVQGLIVADLGPVGTPSTFAQVTTFYDHVVNRTGGWDLVSPNVWLQIKENLARAAYYINGSAGIGGGKASGTVVFNCPGSGVTFTGGTLNTPGGLALLVNGDLTFSGNATIYGGIYATGKITHMTGTVDIYGSIATQGTMDNLGGNLTIHYERISDKVPAVIGSVSTGVNGMIQGVQPRADASGYWDWSEKDLNAFTTP